MEIPHIRRHHTRTLPLACALQLCRGRPGGVPGAPAAKHLTRQRHEVAALCGTNSKATRAGGICFSEMIKPAQFRCSQPRPSSTVPQRRRAPGMRGSRCTGPRPDRRALSRQVAAARVRPGRSHAETRSVLARASGGDGPTPHLLGGRRRCWKRYEWGWVTANIFFSFFLCFSMNLEERGNGKGREGEGAVQSKETATRQKGWCHVLAPQRL